MKKNKPKTNWIIDAILFTGFLLSFWLDLTGVQLHQWLGVGLALLAGYHLLAHLDWVEAVTLRFFRRTSSQSRLYYLLDWALLIGFALILETGLAISTWLNLTLADYALLRDLHEIVSLVTLALVAVKIGLHWRWIVKTARRYFSRPGKPSLPVSTPGRAPQPSNRLAPVSASTSRAEFLRLMGIVGAASLLSALGALDVFADQQPVSGTATLAGRPSSNAASTPIQSDGQSAGRSPASSSQPGASAQTPTAAPQVENTAPAWQDNSSSACTVLCDRGCSYPGNCRRYRDSNNNGRCDLGECA
jgi:hypothetical protein